MVQMLREQLGDTRVLAPDLPDITGAFGAALAAVQSAVMQLLRSAETGSSLIGFRRFIPFLTNPAALRMLADQQ
ncbi:MAG: hypothetical protein D3906_10485 [Candidatus Electrothrix sp. AUS1_2]|nr:hypothetical protein [Candidatus Electrothrix sp. AUS1_2]